MAQAAKDAADMQTQRGLQRAAERAALERADAVAASATGERATHHARLFGNSMRELREAPPASQSTHGAHTYR